MTFFETIESLDVDLDIEVECFGMTLFQVQMGSMKTEIENLSEAANLSTFLLARILHFSSARFWSV